MKYDIYGDDRPRRERRGGCLERLIKWILKQILKIIAVLLVIAVLAAAIVYMLPTGLFMLDPETDLALTDGLPSSPFNVLLLGVDAVSEGSRRSDAMMVASIGRDTFRLTSLQRDMLVEIDGHGVQKLNAAYAYGGPELVMRTVNRALGMNITKYAVVDYTLVVRLVDAVGGIDISVTAEEVQHINKNVLGVRKIFQPLGYTATELVEYGENTHLDGLQALGYSRIRKLDSDFVRTSRQRIVIEATLKKLKQQLWNPVVLTEFAGGVFGGIETNLSVLEIASLGSKALFADEMQQFRLPVNDSFMDNGSSLEVYDWQGNIDAFRNFVYGG